MSRSNRSDGERAELMTGIVSQFQAALGELRCVGSERLVRQGVSMSHLHLMSMLDRHGELPMSRIAELLDVSDSNATGLIDRMEERGFVERVRHPDDRRVVLVRVSDRGRELLGEVEVLGDDVIRRALNRLDDRQLKELASAISVVRAAIIDAAVSEPDTASHSHTHAATAESPRNRAVPQPAH
jgi:DNA-binding MarR family transcriptional regulator